ncbi:MAG: c-type cytochrome [Chloroflexi bacterium]|nr:c-type cytochrome [Chloroflexota bacterium]
MISRLASYGLVGEALLRCCCLPLLAAGLLVGCRPSLGTAELVVQGAQVYEVTCAECHGANGVGMHGVAPPLDSSGQAWLHPDQHLRQFIRDGKPDTGMLAYRELLGREEIEATLAYLKSLWTEEQRRQQEEATLQARIEQLEGGPPGHMH